METKYYKYYDNDYQRKIITNEDLICDEDGNPIIYGTTTIHDKFESGELTKDDVMTITWESEDYGEILWDGYHFANRIGYYIKKRKVV